jgi:hypothetical protein
MRNPVQPLLAGALDAAALILSSLKAAARSVVPLPGFSLKAATLIALALMMAACATPTQPTGGEPDRTGPVVLGTVPETGTINFADDQIRFNFDKYISRVTFQRAFSIEPDVGIAYNVRWRGRSAIVRFESDLPDSTTLIFRLATDLADANNNRLRQPFTLALSTGPAIDEGEITGRLLNLETGRPWTDGIVLLYRHPYDYGERADYAVQPDTGGHVRFNYLREGTYNAFWVDDRNRNKRWDRTTEAARPFPVASVEVTDELAARLDTAYISLPDTTAPQLQGIGLLSAVRMRLRFSEDVTFGRGAAVTVLDSAGNTVHQALPLYAEAAQPNVLLARMPAPVDEQAGYRVVTEGVTDLAGNPAAASDVTFTGSAAADTTAQRIIRNESEGGLYPSEPVVIRYADMITGTAIADSLIIIEDETTHAGWDSVSTDGNLLYIHPKPNWREGSRYQVRAWSPQRQDRVSYDLKVWHPSVLGDLEVTVPGDTAGYWHYRLINKEGRDVKRGHMQGSVLLEGLPEGDYTLQAFSDPDRTGRYDYGSVDPYRAPAPVYVNRQVKIRNRMTTELAVGLRE